MTRTPHAGNATSIERAERMDAADLDKINEARALALLSRREEYGMTRNEFMDLADLSQSTAGATLSEAHRRGLCTRVSDVRGGCQTYVLYEFLDGRTPLKHRGHIQAERIKELESAISAVIAVRDYSKKIIRRRLDDLQHVLENPEKSTHG